MTADNPSFVQVAQARGRLVPNDTNVKQVAVSRARPGVVIFVHGVNDTGANYESVEKGLCQGLNERLDRQDLKAGVYGQAHSRAREVPAGNRDSYERDVLDDPDTYLYQRKDDNAKSIFIPFYWGYRASKDEVMRDEKGEPVRLRTQYQDIHGNRLDRNLGKAGGFFANATNNLRDMYGPGFNSLKRHAAKFLLHKTLFMDRGPHRRYFVLAAERLANLVTTIRDVYPSETITIIGHSQGTLITLLAQALLMDRDKRCADCLILVSSPYSISAKASSAGSDSLRTLLTIVEGVTDAPYVHPTLQQLQAGQPHARGRAGRRWQASQGQRIGKDGATVVFPERDNRGKVYLYFSPDDSTVGLDTVVGIGTFGMPDAEHGGVSMQAQDKLRLYQRMWTRRLRGSGPVVVGDASRFVRLRDETEPRYAGGWSLASVAASAPLSRDGVLYINAEPLVPAHAPAMFGGEAITGSATQAGKDRPDAVTCDIALGNRRAKFPWIRLIAEYTGMTPEAALAEFNRVAGDEDQQTRAVRTRGPTNEMGVGPRELEREMTPDEVRVWMTQTPSEWTDNSYHSAVLRDPENHRWVTAMDVAIGQGHSLDDPDFRALLLFMADWKMTKRKFLRAQKASHWSLLDAPTKALIAACFAYYKDGLFPSNELVDLKRLPLALVHGRVPT